MKQAEQCQADTFYSGDHEPTGATLSKDLGTADARWQKLYVGEISAIGNTQFGNDVTADVMNVVSRQQFNSVYPWEDIRVAVFEAIPGGANDPDLAQFKDNGAGSTGVYTYWFDATSEEELFFTVQIPHDYKEGTDIYAHVHWVPKSNGVFGQDVSWGLEYTVANSNGVFGNTTIIYGDDNRQGDLVLDAGRHYETNIGSISGASLTLSAMLVCRIFRDATGAGGTDDYTDDAGLLEIDFHYQKDAIGSDAEWSKT